MPGRKSRSGGYRSPSTPAAASGPGSASQRTDGGPSDSQPSVSLEGFDAQFHGQRQQLEAIASQTGVPDPSPQPPSSPPSSPSTSPIPPSTLDVFRPATSTPNRTFAYQLGAASVPRDPDLLTRALYAAYRHPDLLRMLNQIRGRI